MLKNSGNEWQVWGENGVRLPGEVAIMGSAEINAENLFNGTQSSSPQSQSLYC